MLIYNEEKKHVTCQITWVINHGMGWIIYMYSVLELHIFAVCET